MEGKPQQRHCDVEDSGTEGYIRMELFIALIEIFASITGLENAFSRVPGNMRSVVTGVNLLRTGFSPAISQAACCG